MANDTRIALDLAKTVIQVTTSERPGQVSKTQRMTPSQCRRFLREHPPAVVVMEACGMAHHWGRYVRSVGHRPELLPPHQVRPYVLRNKTDRTDTVGILEAQRNDDVKRVPVKTEEQQAIAALHRLRSAWMDSRVARLNTIRGLLREFGITIAGGAEKVVPFVWQVVGDADSELPPVLREPLIQAAQEIRELEQRCRQIEKQLGAIAKASEMIARLMTVPGIGLLTSTMLFAIVGDPNRFPSGRHLSSFIGVTAREWSSGGRRRLGGISKRGDVYLRMLLVHGARSVLLNARRSTKPDRLRAWALQLNERVGHNRATVAVANKLARIAWAVWRNGRDYTALPAAA
jgi:transposase